MKGSTVALIAVGMAAVGVVAWLVVRSVRKKREETAQGYTIENIGIAGEDLSKTPSIKPGSTVDINGKISNSHTSSNNTGSTTKPGKYTISNLGLSGL